MQSRCVTILSFSCAFCVTHFTLADTVYLKNGAWIDGIVRTRNPEVLQIEIGSIGKLEIPIEEVYEIEKNSRTGGASTLSVAGRELEVKVDPREQGKRKKESEGAAGDDDAESRSTADADDTDDNDATSKARLDKVANDESENETLDEDEEDSIDPELKERIEKLVDDLKRQKSKFRVRAQRHLKAVGPPAIPFLLPLASDQSELVRVAVFRLFYAFGDDRVIDDCIESLVDTNEYVRDYAHRTLRRVTGENFGYKPFASPRRREAASKKWRRWWKDEKKVLEALEEQGRA